MSKKSLLILLCLLFTFFLFAQEQQNQKVLSIGIESDIDVTGLWETIYSVNEKVFWNVCEPLVAIDEKSSKIKPNLATSWEARDKNRIWILGLRDGVKFHDGSNLTADDVVASASLFQKLEASVEKINSLTVKFTLPTSDSSFLYKLAHPSRVIAPANVVNRYKSLKTPNKLEAFVPIGTGPFKFSRREPDKRIIFDAFTDYWQGTPWVERLIYQIIPDNKARIAALEKGEIDIIDIIFPADMPQITANANANIISRHGMNVCFLSMNTTHKPLDNIKVRQALNMAIDKMKLARMFYYGGYGVPTNRMLSPGFWGFSALPTPSRYQPPTAKQLLAETQYNKDINLKLICVPRARPYLPDPSGVAEEIKRQFAAVGVKVDIIIPADFAEFNSLRFKGEFDLALWGWINITGDPDYTLNYLLNSKDPTYNDSRWYNNSFDEKLSAARELPLSDIRGRIKLYNDAQNIVQEEVPLIPLIHTNIFVIHNKKVKGIILYPTSMISYHKVEIES
jgi:peptide/nickel transport system substrate-binding protein